MKKNLPLLLLCTILSYSINAQTYIRHIGTSGKWEQATQSSPRTDKGHIVLAENDNFESRLLHLDSNGALMWAKAYTWGNNVLEITSIAVNENNEIAAVAYIDNDTASIAFFIKTNSSGDIQIAKVLRIDGTIALHGITTCANGDYLVTGVTEYFNNQLGATGYVARVNANGNILWNRSITIDDDESFNRTIFVRETQQGDILLAGTYIQKLNANGDVLWLRKYTGSDGEEWGIEEFVEQTNGNIGITSFEYDNAGDVFTVIVEMDGQGNLLQTMGYRLANEHIGNFDIQIAPGGGYDVLCDREDFSSNVPGSTYIMRVNSSLQPTAYFNLDLPHSNLCWTFKPNTDGSYLLTGQYYNEDSVADMLLVKVSPSLSTACSYNNTPVEAFTHAITDTLLQTLTFDSAVITSNITVTAQPVQLQETLTCFATSIEEATATNRLLLYPNPANDIATVSYNNMDWSKGEARLEITNNIGQVVHSQSLPMYSGFQKLNVANYAGGAYAVCIKRGQVVVATGKLVKGD